jgi:hypothetical protein
VTEVLDRTNRVGSALTFQLSSASNGSDLWLASAQETWNHDFGPRTSSQLGFGMSVGRTWRTDGYIAYSIYPTFLSALVHQEPTHPGTLVFTVGLTSAPVLDPSPYAIVLDPRVTILGTIAWQRERFFATVGGNTTFSYGGPAQNTIALFGGSAGVGYQFGKAFSMDGGVRAAYQDYAGAAVLPLTYAAFVGMTFGLSGALN